MANEVKPEAKTSPVASFADIEKGFSWLEKQPRDEAFLAAGSRTRTWVIGIQAHARLHPEDLMLASMAETVKEWVNVASMAFGQKVGSGRIYQGGVQVKLSPDKIAAQIRGSIKKAVDKLVVKG